ncbi:TolC family protein [Desulfobacula sp.]|uniref:TolC family protein n=1 Tax=Desulfobacula sp. TaxID=2593537 RepID=UPI0026241E47|nr:TolC family protein [Desulfobacula sp.]
MAYTTLQHKEAVRFKESGNSNPFDGRKTENFLIRIIFRRLWAGVVLCLLILQGTPLIAADSDLTFIKALENMLTRNESIQMARSEIGQKEYEAMAARGLDLPKVTLSGRLTRIDDPIYLDLNPIRDVILAMHPTVPSAMVPSFQETIQEDTFFKAQLNMVWPVYTGGKITAAKKAADAGIRESEAKMRRTSGTLTSELVRYYFAVRLMDQVLNIRTEVKNALDLHLFQARRLQEEGFIARTELLHAQVAKAQADRELKASRRDLDLARTALANILASDDIVNPSTQLFLVPSIGPVDSFVDQARKNHPALDQVQAVRDKARENLKGARSELYPEVYLFGIRELYEDDLTALDPTWAIGVGVNFTLFDGRTRSNRIMAARKIEKQAKLVHHKLARDLETLVSSRHQELMKDSEQFDALQASLELAEENLRARKRSFEEGFATSLDVVDAQMSLSGIQVERMKAAYSFDVALAQLLEACGRGADYPRYLAGKIVEVEN